MKGIDQLIPPSKMWEAFRHVLKPSGTVVWFGSQPFISQAICANLDHFRYDLIWRKMQSGFLNCNNRPLKEHQTIAVFSERAPVFNPQMEPGTPYLVRRNGKSDVYKRGRTPLGVNESGNRFPSSVLTFKQAGRRNVHPFEKPLPLCEWIVRTFTHPGMAVLDPTFGGGSSGVACRVLGRSYIGIEQDRDWFIVGRDRILTTPEPAKIQALMDLAQCGD